MLNGIHKIHLIGIAGSGMRAIANILISQGLKYPVPIFRSQP